MNNQKIVFNDKNGYLVILTPTPECLNAHTIEEIAEKDVPEGLPYKIINASEIPQDRTFRGAWEINEAELTDGVGSSVTSFDEVSNDQN
jgi:hypothetical protein